MKFGYDVHDKAKEKGKEKEEAKEIEEVKEIESDDDTITDETAIALQERFMRFFDSIDYYSIDKIVPQDQHFKQVYDFLLFFKDPPLNKIFNFNQVIEVGPSKGLTPLILIIAGRKNVAVPAVLDTVFEHFPLENLDFNAFSTNAPCTPLVFLVDAHVWLNSTMPHTHLEVALEKIPFQLDFDTLCFGGTLKDYIAASDCESLRNLLPKINFIMSMRESKRLEKIWEEEQTDENLANMQAQMEKTEQFAEVACESGFCDAYCMVADFYFELNDTVNFNEVMRNIRKLMEMGKMPDMIEWYNQKHYDFALKCLDAKPAYVIEMEKNESAQDRQNRILCALKAAQEILPKNGEDKQEKKDLCRHLGFMFTNPTGMQSGPDRLLDRVGANNMHKFTKAALLERIQHQQEMQEKQHEIDALKEKLKKQHTP